MRSILFPSSSFHNFNFPHALNCPLSMGLCISVPTRLHSVDYDSLWLHFLSFPTKFYLEIFIDFLL